MLASLICDVGEFQRRLFSVEALSDVIMSCHELKGCLDPVLRSWLEASQFFIFGQAYSQHPNRFPFHVLILWVTVC